MFLLRSSESCYSALLSSVVWPAVLCKVVFLTMRSSSYQHLSPYINKADKECVFGLMFLPWFTTIVLFGCHLYSHSFTCLIKLCYGKCLNLETSVVYMNPE